MSYEIGTATSYTNLLNKLNTFLTAKGKAFNPSYIGTGNGTISLWDGGATSVAETFTLAATSATNFTVTGSISGSIGPATVGVAFVHAKLCFTLTAGGTPFVAGDTFLINTSSPWVSMRAVAGSEMIWKAKGNDDTREIYTGALCFNDVGGDYYNWRLQGFTAYTAGNTFYNQPGCIGTLGIPSPIFPLWNGSIPYWFVANGQRVIVVAKIASVYEHAYLGLISPYIDPGSYPLPLLVGGGMAFLTEPAVGSASWKYSNSSDLESHSYWRGTATPSTPSYGHCSNRLRDPAGVWQGFTYGSSYDYQSGRPGQVWPWSALNYTVLNLRENMDGTYPLLPILYSSNNGAIDGETVNIWGELDGVKATSGHIQASENTIAEGLFTHVVFQDIYRVVKDAFCAIKLN
jgi:hypothetical protein